MKHTIKVIAFDADDTLWSNEPFFQEVEHRLVVATKGDLLDQERKLHRSGLTSYFDHIEIMSDKTEKEYSRLLQILQVAPEEFMMIGNSLKSDIQPVLAIGGYGVHIPFEVMWRHEVMDAG
ncbi:HAD family hydrolase [Bacteroides sp.]|uniref:HAD family hydrolase n=1 Tax=Bacteroides sp. TaxID=29523 RepID=UPI003A8CED67